MDYATSAAFAVSPPVDIEIEGDEKPSEVQKLPTPQFFTDALLTVLARLVNYRAEAPVKVDRSTLYRPVLIEAGINPDTHPLVLSGHWPLHQSGNKPSLFRKVNLCFRYRKEASNPLVYQERNHVWGLTKKGAQVALEARRLEDPDFLPDWNVTGSYFSRRGPHFRNRLQELATSVGFEGELDFEAFIRIDGISQAQTTVGGNKKSIHLREVLQAMCPELELPPIPSNKFFRTAVVDMIAEKADYRANVGVRFDSDVNDEVLRRLDINPDTDPRVTSGLWPKVGKGSLYRQINLALTKQRVHFSQVPKSVEPVVIWVGKGVYALTERGIEQAMERKPAPAPVDPAQLVRDWLNQEISKGLLETMRSVLSNKLSKSYNLGEIDDLINSYLCEILGSEKFAERIASGNIPTHRTLSSWACRRAYSRFRNAGKDAHQRTLREANTARERTRDTDGELDKETIHEAVVSISTFGEHTPIHLVNNPEGQVNPRSGSHTGTPLLDVSDPVDTEEAVLASIDRARGLKRLEQTIKRNKPGAPERYWGIFEQTCEGLSCKEIAEKEGVSRNRAASLMASMREALDQGRINSDRAATIMEYISDRPGTTASELESEFGYGLKTITQICGWLQESDCLREHKIRKARSYSISQKGVAVLRERADAGEWSPATHVIV